MLYPLLVATLSLSPLIAATGTYKIAENLHADTFLPAFTFANHYDNTTSGDVVYVGSNSSLAYVNSASNVVLKVDTAEVPYNEKRNSVRLDSKSTYGVGTVWVFDAVHLPWGCSQWPAFWMTSDTWPAGGEIDVLEGVNRQTKNQMALHTTAGCTLTSSSSMSGSVGETNCNATNGAGCTVFDNNELSFGEDFNAAGGGVWVTELSEDGVGIWFFSRSDVPSSLTASASSVDTSSLGTPSAFFSSASCSPVSDYLYGLRTVIDTTLCGVWAGSVLGSTGCEAPVSPATCYSTYVLNSTNYVDAYWEIGYLNIFSNSSSSASTTGKSSSSASASRTAAAASSAESSTKANNTSAAGSVVASSTIIVGVFVASLLALAMGI